MELPRNRHYYASSLVKKTRRKMGNCYTKPSSTRPARCKWRARPYCGGRSALAIPAFFIQQKSCAFRRICRPSSKSWTPGKIEHFIPQVMKMTQSCLITTEKCRSSITAAMVRRKKRRLTRLLALARKPLSGSRIAPVIPAKKRGPQHCAQFVDRIVDLDLLLLKLGQFGDETLAQSR